MDGQKEVLGLWISKNEGVADVFIACVDGLKGFEEAINAVFPQTTVQLYIVHMVRNRLKFMPWKDRKAVAADLKSIYSAPSETNNSL